MAALVFLVLVMAMFGCSDAAWCICKPDVGDGSSQKALDYACGAGADCNPILQSGSCYNPNSVKAHCSYAVNSYYQRKQQAQGACDFQGAATLTTTDPSSSGCTYPASPSAAATSSTPSTTSSSTTAGNFGTGGGMMGGLGPSANVNSDTSDGGLLPTPWVSSLFFAFMFSALVLFRS